VTILTVHSTGPYKTAVASRIADAEPSPNKVNFCIGKAPSGKNFTAARRLRQKVRSYTCV
jgi:hypothetical protein